MISLVDHPIDTTALLAAAQRPEAGAVVLFLGVTREWTDDAQTATLHYDAYRPMAEAVLSKLRAAAIERWSLVDCLIVHRLGEVPLGEASVAIVASAAHRGPAFAAAEWLIDILKRDVPIWKQEHAPNGTTQWVHPQLDQSMASTHSLPQLVDSFGRVHTDLRLSVTDRCNIRCSYCMPAEAVKFLPKEQILTFEEIERFVRVAVGLGIDRVRLTGGEPLVRAQLPQLVARLRQQRGLRDLALTTNGVLLAEQAAALRAAGLNRLNISLDTLDPQKFERLTRRRLLDRVLAGIDAAVAVGFAKIRLNAIALRGETESEVVPLVRFARGRAFELRFIEYMPLDADHTWEPAQVLSGDELRAIIEDEFGPLLAAPRHDPSQPAVDFHFADGCGSVGFIHPVTQPFCGDCNRLRLTAEGQIRNCLFSTREWDARAMLRTRASDDELSELIREAIAHKAAGHGIDGPNFVRPERAMYQIGG